MTAIIVVGIVGVVLLACGLGYYFLMKGAGYARNAARRTANSNNLHQISIAIHNFHDVYGHLPAHANYDPNGKPLLSWRVHVLPLMEHGQLYERFHLDEPWDSPHNSQLTSQMPIVYRHPEDTGADGKTRYLAIIGPGTMFPLQPGSKPETGIGTLRLADIPDGLPGTLMVLEAPPEQAVIWTKPDDWQYTPQSLDQLAAYVAERKYVLAARADASVSALKSDTGREDLRHLLEINDGK
ncbi:MAG: DUF1559 domain-containing protein [Planctomycetia bacterium]|nr:DUF1559 domain-containing protein [Planctomycetia bacterium]